MEKNILENSLVGLIRNKINNYYCTKEGLNFQSNKSITVGDSLSLNKTVIDTKNLRKNATNKDVIFSYESKEANIIFQTLNRSN